MRCVGFSDASASKFLIAESGIPPYGAHMPTLSFEPRDARNASLHALVCEIEQELTRLAPSPAHTELRASWAKLVEVLALDPLAELMECPTCQHVGMRAATRCRYCWTKLVPPAASADARDGAIARGTD